MRQFAKDFAGNTKMSFAFNVLYNIINDSLQSTVQCYKILNLILVTFSVVPLCHLSYGHFFVTLSRDYSLHFQGKFPRENLGS